MINLIGLTLFVWGVAIWASLEEKQERPEEPPQENGKQEMKPEAEDRSTHGRKAA